MPAVSGYRGRVEVDGKVFRANRWTVEYSVETDDATGTFGVPDSPFDMSVNSGKHRLPAKTYYAKLVDISVTIDAFYDTHHGYFKASGATEGSVAPVNVYMVPGREINLKLYPAHDKGGGLVQGPSLNRDGSYWHFPTFLILTCSHVTEARGVGKISFTGKNNSKDYDFVNL